MFSSNIISLNVKKLMRKKSKEDEQTLEELNSAHRRSQQNVSWYKPVT